MLHILLRARDLPCVSTVNERELEKRERDNETRPDHGPLFCGQLDLLPRARLWFVVYTLHWLPWIHIYDCCSKELFYVFYFDNLL